MPLTREDPTIETRVLWALGDRLATIREADGFHATFPRESIFELADNPEQQLAPSIAMWIAEDVPTEYVGGRKRHKLVIALRFRVKAQGSAGGGQKGKTKLAGQILGDLQRVTYHALEVPCPRAPNGDTMINVTIPTYEDSHLVQPDATSEFAEGVLGIILYPERDEENPYLY